MEWLEPTCGSMSGWAIFSTSARRVEASSCNPRQTTPVVNDGVMFTTSTALAYNRVHAVNAVTGELLWKYEHKVPEDVGALVRIIPHNRGVALHKDRVIFGTLDARLVMLEAKTGKLVWETRIADYADGYFVSQAPLVVKGKVIVG